VFDLFLLFKSALGDGESGMLMLNMLIKSYKLQREFDRRFQDFRNLENGIQIFSIPFEIDAESVPIDVQMEQWFLIVGAHLPGVINTFPRDASLMRFENTEILINKYTKTYICFYSLFKVRLFETKDNY